MARHRVVSVLFAFLLASMSLISLSTPAVEPNIEVEKIYSIRIEELPGGAISPGGASSFRFEYEYLGERALFWGWTGPNDLRVMDKDLTTVKVLELPTEDFEVHGARWTSGMSIIAWGNNGTGPEDTVLFYTYPDLELDPSFVPREVIPLSTIDSAHLLAGNLILAVAGRASNGTSQLVIVETLTDVVHRVHDIHDNLTVQTLGDVGFSLLALDVEGGAMVFNTTGWFYERHIELIDGPFSWAHLRTNHPWTLGGENGRLLMRKDHLLNQTISLVVDPPPLQAACWFSNDVSDNFLVASPSADGGSIIKVYQSLNGTYEQGTEVRTEGTVTSVMSNGTLTNTIGVSFSEGEFKRYHVTENQTFITRVLKPDDDGGPRWWAPIPGTVLLLVVVAVVVLWYRRGRTTG